MARLVSHFRSGVVLGVALTALVLATVAEAQAPEGQLDTSFGSHGQVVTEFPFNFMGIDPDGAISLLGGSQVTRLQPDGQPDPAFGTAGSEVLPKTIEGSPYAPSALAVDQQGRMVLFGSAYPPEYPVVGREPESVQISRAFVMRLNSEGRLDPSFGEGRGAIVSSFGLSSSEPKISGQPTTRVLGGMVDSQDRPVLLAGVAEGFSPCISHSFLASSARAIVRLTPSGTGDPTFGGGDGISTMLRNVNALPLPRLGLTGSDQPLVAGAEGRVCAQIGLAFRFTGDGMPLLHYGNHGKTRFAFKRFGSFSAFTASGGLILRKDVPVASRVLRVTPTGLIDRGFGRNGFAVVHLPGGTNRSLYPVAADSRGRVLLVGSYSRQTALSGQKHAFLVVERLTRSGQPDLGFGRGGMIATRVPAAQVLGHKEAALDSQGCLLVLSQVSRAASGSDAKAVLTRFKMGG
jgi:uncharacterized delta-60 repeat protein